MKEGKEVDLMRMLQDISTGLENVWESIKRVLLEPGAGLWVGYLMGLLTGLVVVSR